MRDEEKKELSFISRPSSLIPKIRRALRGEVDPRTVALETLRRGTLRLRRKRERAQLDQLNKSPARLSPQFARLSPTALLAHFRRRDAPVFFPGLDARSLDATVRLQRELFPEETVELLSLASRMMGEHRWRLLGYGEKGFGRENIEWLRDPLSGAQWPLDYHASLSLASQDGSDARVLWELNRLSHFIIMGRAFRVSGDERLASEFFAQCESWRGQNPLGLGPNWACAMEVALRAMNLLAAFELFLSSTLLDEDRLGLLLTLLDQHGAHIRRNLEFSYISTSNHYLSDVVGLFWIGLMLPELADARQWRDWALKEMLSEMDKQVLADGADWEASTGYHRFVLELFLYSFILCRANQIKIEDRYWQRLRAMLEYVSAYLRPCGRAPLVGDTDSGQVMPLRARSADDHAYVLALGAVVFDEPRFKDQSLPIPEELLWMMGEQGLKSYQSLEAAREGVQSQAFTEAGIYVMRRGDLYLLFNASGNGLDGRGSHGHNDALSLEVSACGRSFIIDPGTYVYTSDVRERALFRSTRYHSTIEVDGAEQNRTDEQMPFVMGDEAHPRVLVWEAARERDRIVAEHDGYARLPQPVTHRRSVVFDKRAGYWAISETLTGEGEHVFRTRCHFAEKLEVSIHADKIVRACDKMTGALLVLVPVDEPESAEIEELFASRDYGEKHETRAACWTLHRRVPVSFRWLIVPVRAGEDEMERVELARESACHHWK